jgi:hypothetical protein
MGLRRDAGLQRQFYGGKHGLFVMLEDQGQDLDHLAVAARRLEHALLQSPEGGRQFDERRAVTQGSRLALNNREIVPPVVNCCGALPFVGAGKNAVLRGKTGARVSSQWKSTTWAHVKAIGWTKLRLIARVRDKQNANHWIDFASKHNKPEIIKEVNLHLASTGKANATTSTATHLKSYKLHDDQDSTVDAAIKKAKQASGTQDDSVALENICLDYLGGHTFAHRTRAIGPTSAAKGIKDAFTEQEDLVAFVKEFDVIKLLDPIEAAAPNIEIVVTIPGDPTKAQDGCETP